MQGKFLVSLDFELFWGVQDNAEIDGYGKNVLGVWSAVPKLLELFEKYEIHATWATVGFMFANDYEELQTYLVEKDNRPTYEKEILSSYRCFDNIACDKGNEKLFYAPSLIEVISKTKGQEIASHSFSHYYCDEKGQTVEQFKRDMQSAIDIAKSKGYELKSFVFPRNQSEEKYVNVLKELGFSSYRAMATNWIHHKVKKGTIRRGLRLLDVYLPLTGSNSYQPKEENGIYNFPGSNMFKPKCKALFFLEWLKVYRIKSQMKTASKKGLVYHLWWHPHNLGVNTEYHLKQLEKIFKYRDKLNAKYGMQSFNMREFVEYSNKSKGKYE